MSEITEELASNWYTQLKQAFTGSSGWSSEDVLLLQQMEQQHFEELFKRQEKYATLLDAFLAFSMQTISEAYKHSPQPSAYRFAFFIASFQRFRSSYNNYWDGYYSEAASHLRSLFENLLSYGAVLNDYITETDLLELIYTHKVEGMSLKEYKQFVYRHHASLAKKVQRKMIGADSGLSEPDQEALKDEIGILHSHVHRASATQEKIVWDTIQGVQITCLPVMHEGYANKVKSTTIYAAWAFTRILPFISTPNLFTQDWLKKYRALNESFLEMVDDDASAIDETFSRFIKTKMNFVV